MSSDLLPSIKNLADPCLWLQPWFQSMLVEGMRREGLSDESCVWIKRVLLNYKPSTLEKLQVLASDLLENVSPEIRSEVTVHLEKLLAVSRTNGECYIRDTPEKTRVTQWPNNPSIRVRNPSHYFDIHQDLFFRDRHPIIRTHTPIGSAGSCFALRIAHQLQAWGYNYVIEEDDLPVDFPLENLTETSFRMAPARIGTLFNVPSMRQMVERAFGLWEPERVIVETQGRFIDPFRAVKSNYVDYAGFELDYRAHTEALRRALLACEVFVLTLGLTESWQFAHSGAYTSLAPYQIDPALLRRKELTVDENVSELERLFSIYKSYQPNLKLIISVSPVPLNKTFSSSQHVVAANSLSKATLRVAADIFVRNHPGEAFYFPSYETVLSGTLTPWEKDMRHVSSDAVRRVMQLFSAMFMENPGDLDYLNINPMKDVRKTPFMHLKNLLRPIKRGILK